MNLFVSNYPICVTCVTQLVKTGGLYRRQLPHLCDMCHTSSQSEVTNCRITFSVIYRPMEWKRRQGEKGILTRSFVSDITARWQEQKVRTTLSLYEYSKPARNISSLRMYPNETHISKSDSFEHKFELARFQMSDYTSRHERADGISTAGRNLQAPRFNPAHRSHGTVSGAVHREAENKAFAGRLRLPCALRRCLPRDWIRRNFPNGARLGHRLRMNLDEPDLQIHS